MNFKLILDLLLPYSRSKTSLLNQLKISGYKRDLLQYYIVNYQALNKVKVKKIKKTKKKKRHKKIKRSEIMEKKQVKFGYTKEIENMKALLKERETLKTTRNSTEDVDNRLEKEVWGKVLFSPLDALFIQKLYNKSFKAEDKAMLTELSNKEVEMKKVSPIKDIVAEIKGLIGTNKNLKRVCISKYNSVTRNYTEYSYLPGSLRVFDNPMTITTVHELPSSIYRAVLETSQSLVTKDDTLILVFASLVYNQHTDTYTTHQWKVVYEVLDSDELDSTDEDQEFEEL